MRTRTPTAAAQGKQDALYAHLHGQAQPLTEERDRERGKFDRVTLEVVFKEKRG